MASRQRISSGFSTSSTAPRRATGCAPARAGPGDLPRLRRGDGRNHRRWQPHGPNGRGLHDHACPSGQDRRDGDCRMSAARSQVLVVDDEPPIRKLLRMGLGPKDIDVVEAANGKAALAAAAEARPRHPRSRPARHPGHGAAAQLRGQGVDVAVVILSSRTDEAGNGRRRWTRRGRLRHQAVRHEGADRPHSRRLAPPLAAAGRAADLPGRATSPSISCADRQGARPGGEAVAPRVRDPAHARSACRQGADPSVSARPALGESADAQYVRVYVRQLRNKIEPQPDRPEYIHTETGVGYRLRLPD